MNNTDVNAVWFKVVGMLQQTWAHTAPMRAGGVLVSFYGDDGEVFDQLAFDEAADADRGLRRNGFRRYARDRAAQKLLTPPACQPMSESQNRPIYSTGQFWKLD